MHPGVIPHFPGLSAFTIDMTGAIALLSSSPARDGMLTSFDLNSQLFFGFELFILRLGFDSQFMPHH
jgi:hypothetical protein